MGQVVSNETNLQSDDCVVVEETPAAKLVHTRNTGMLLGLLSGDVLAFVACYVPLSVFAQQTGASASRGPRNRARLTPCAVLPAMRPLSLHNLGFALTLSTFTHTIFNGIIAVHDDDAFARKDVVIVDEDSWDPLPLDRGAALGLGPWSNGILAGTFARSLHVHFSVLWLNRLSREGNAATMRMHVSAVPLLEDGRGRLTLTLPGPPSLRIVFDKEDGRTHIRSMVVRMSRTNAVGTW